MIRNLKMLGLAMMAMFAFSAVATSVASAVEPFEFTFGAKSTLTGAQVASEPNEFKTKGGAIITCANAHFDGVGTYENPTTDVTVTPTYSNCVAHVGASTFPATVTHNGCTYTFTAGTLLETHTGEGSVHLVCPTNPIEIHIYQNAHNHTTGISLCTLTVGSQTISPIHYKYDTTEKTVTATSKGSISYTRHGSILCGAASSTAEYLGNSYVEALNEAGTRVEGTFD
jgi:hypothetical protein